MLGKARTLHEGLGGLQAVDLGLGVVGRPRTGQGEHRVLQLGIPQAEDLVVPGHPAQVRVAGEAALAAQAVAHSAQGTGQPGFGQRRIMGAAAARHLAAEGAEVVGVVAADRFDGEAQRCQRFDHQAGLVMAGEEGDTPRQGLGGMMPMGGKSGRHGDDSC